MPDPVTDARVVEPCKELAEAVARCFEVDPHQWSTRPCQTCRAITGIIGRDFGCVAYAKKRGVRD